MQALPCNEFCSIVGKLLAVTNTGRMCGCQLEFCRLLEPFMEKYVSCGGLQEKSWWDVGSGVLDKWFSELLDQHFKGDFAKNSLKHQ